MQRREEENEGEGAAMIETITLVVPATLTNSFFFSENETLTVAKDTLQVFNVTIPFQYEVAFFSAIEAIKPWEYPEEYAHLLIREWQNDKILLEELFAKRNRKQTADLMKKGISLFLEFVYWTNGFPVELSRNLVSEKLKVHPVNLEERLKFIIERSTLYHSFIQLNELMIEMEKQWVKQLALKKAFKQ